jgi:hypothetical protein
MSAFDPQQQYGVVARLDDPYAVQKAISDMLRLVPQEHRTRGFSVDTAPLGHPRRAPGDELKAEPMLILKWTPPTWRRP